MRIEIWIAVFVILGLYFLLMWRGGAVILRAYENSGNVKIQIIDSGKGIPHQELDKIFLPFYTTKSEGSGLGLAITKRIVEAHGAIIEVDSKEGTGTRFMVVLPAG